MNIYNFIRISMQDTVRHTCKETGKDDKVDSSIFQQRQYSCPVHPFGLAHTGERNIQTTCTFQNKGTLSISQNQLYVHQFAILEITDDILGIRTYYEQQWLDRGLTIKYVKFRLPRCGGLQEPDVEIELDEYRSYNRSKRSGLQTGK